MRLIGRLCSWGARHLMEAKYRRLLLPVVLASLLLTLAEPASATANRTKVSPLTPRTLRLVVQPMYVDGFDAKVAAAHGMQIRHLADGRAYIAPIGSPANAPVQPENVIYGNCGYSYVWLYDTGYRQYTVKTGFHVNQAAVRYGWAAEVNGPYNFYKRHTWGGGLNFRTDWAGSASSGVPGPGYYFTFVETGSYAVLWTGVTCHSGGPTDSEYVS